MKDSPKIFTAEAGLLPPLTLHMCRRGVCLDTRVCTGVSASLTPGTVSLPQSTRGEGIQRIEGLLTYTSASQPRTRFSVNPELGLLSSREQASTGSRGS